MKSICRNLFLISLVTGLFAPQSLAAQSTPPEPEDLVNPMVGTANDGQTSPSAGVPHAMTQWTAATREGEKKGQAPYYYADTEFRGVRGSHFLSGSATQEYGSVQIAFGNGSKLRLPALSTLKLDHTHEKSLPYLYTASFPDEGLEAALSGTERCGFLQIKSARGGALWVAIENFAQIGDGNVIVDAERRQVYSQSAARRIYAGLGKLAGFSGHSVIEFDHPFEVGGVWSKRHLSGPGVAKDANSQGVWIVFQLKPQEAIQIRIGTSFTSQQEAEKNLCTEIGGWQLSAVVDHARATWHQQLHAIDVEGSATDRRIFYTAMYHALLLPRIFSDADGTYLSFGGSRNVEHMTDHIYYDDFSIWDTFRALHPLLTVIDPARECEMIQSLIDKGKQGGFLPIFPAWNSYTAEMDGDHGIAIIGDGWVKGLNCFDKASAYLLMRQNAFSEPATQDEYVDGKGRRALTSYLKYGYIPLEDHVPDAMHKDEQVARTLDYAYDDWILARIARTLGESKDADLLDARAQNYKNVIDPDTGFARGRHADGTWITPFDPTKPASFVTEGVPFQFTFYVLQDIPGLIRILHGDDAFVKRLNALFDQKLYDHGNEPSHHIAYLYDYASAPWLTQKKIHELVVEQYKDSPAGLAGNDDAGQMSAWYLFSALGFYPVTPGSPVYAIGTPHFKNAVLHLKNGKDFEIEARNLSEDAFYIRRLSLNGKPLHRFWLTHSELVQGGKLSFDMTDTPTRDWFTEKAQ